ncbi:hypothetical protein MKEN_00543700 [Mycena kentingensis (nom. inval.)]|nr:hypothetical protein MKEN_00543700 [Mycena kentingensis (nom. inval.)]
MDIAMFLWRFIRGLFEAPAPTVPPVDGPTLVSLPGDILGLIFEYIRELETPANVEEPYGNERLIGAPLIPLSMTCRQLRAFARGWIFAEMYNWDRGGGFIWPETLWPVFRTLHIRDRAVRDSQPIVIPQQLWPSLASMDAIQSLTLRISVPVSCSILQHLDRIPHLRKLDIYEARLDDANWGDLPRLRSLSTLSLRVSGFLSGRRPPDVDRATELGNVDTLLHHLSAQLNELCISGELVSPQFSRIHWPALCIFAVRDERPVPFVSISQLTQHMPHLAEWRALFAMFIPTEWPHERPTIGDADAPYVAGPRLASVSISNWNADDPIFVQLPDTLEGLRLVDVQARHEISWSFRTVPYPLVGTIARISHLRNLRKLELTSAVQAMPDELWKLAESFPLLVELSMNHRIYWEERLTWVDEHLNECMEPLRALQNLKHLRVTIHFTIYIDYRGVPVYGAYRVLESVPQLERVSFRGAQDPDVLPKWDTWNRSILAGSCPPPRPGYPDIEEDDR